MSSANRYGTTTGAVVGMVEPPRRLIALQRECVGRAVDEARDHLRVVVDLVGCAHDHRLRDAVGVGRDEVTPDRRPPLLCGTTHVNVTWPSPGTAFASCGGHGTSPRNVVFGCTGSSFGGRGLLREVEVLAEVAEDLHLLADRRAGIGATVGRRVESLPAEEHVLDELEVRVEAERLVVDDALAAYGLITNDGTRMP